MTERLTVDDEGKIIIPPEIIQRHGLRPGDEVALVEAAEGLLMYQGGADPDSHAWWDSLTEEERHRAEAEARQYEALGDKGRDALWSEDAESIDASAEGDEIELPAGSVLLDKGTPCQRNTPPPMARGNHPSRQT